ncbi:Multidrug resistance-associated protein 4 [Nymphon striatum]|nr:Multidrug resistance-associated protein 4 [Nymphon striatum]
MNSTEHMEYAFKLDKLFIVIFKLKDKKNVVKGISFELNPGDYLCVIGEVGSGKTSLLKTVLKELVINRGIVKVSGKIAYACQQSWIFADTLKNNIIFGSKYDKEKYQNVINTCCLCKDINDMPNGDETLVGERGIRLSGGQRARISLARALYYDADIYLLDDPLSAVDAEVGNSLYSHDVIDAARDVMDVVRDVIPVALMGSLGAQLELTGERDTDRSPVCGGELISGSVWAHWGKRNGLVSSV